MFTVLSAPVPRANAGSLYIPLNSALLHKNDKNDKMMMIADGGAKIMFRQRMLSALLVAVPQNGYRVARFELQLDGHPIMQVPAIAAASMFGHWKGCHHSGDSTIAYKSAAELRYTHYCLMLGAMPHHTNTDYYVTGELDLTSPAVRQGKLHLRIVYGPGGAPGAPGAPRGAMMHMQHMQQMSQMEAPGDDDAIYVQACIVQEECVVVAG